MAHVAEKWRSGVKSAAKHQHAEENQSAEEALKAAPRWRHESKAWRSR